MKFILSFLVCGLNTNMNMFAVTCPKELINCSMKPIIVCIAGKPLENYTQEDLVELFHYIGMEKYVYVIKSDNIVGEEIINFEVEDFSEAGVKSLLDQMKLFLTVSRLKRGETAQAHQSFHYVVPFLKSKPDLREYIPLFKEKQIDDELLPHCTAPLLKEIGLPILVASKIIVLFRKYKESDCDSEISSKELITKMQSVAIKDKDKYMKVITENNLSFSLLKEGGTELLEELGLSRPDSRAFMRKLHIS